MVEFAFLRQLVNLLFNFWSLIILDRHASSLSSAYPVGYVVWVKKLSVPIAAFKLIEVLVFLLLVVVKCRPYTTTS
jgi:hypothetical protein